MKAAVIQSPGVLHIQNVPEPICAPDFVLSTVNKLVLFSVSILCVLTAALNAQTTAGKTNAIEYFAPNDCVCRETTPPAGARARVPLDGGTTCFYLYPYNLHLTSGVTSSIPLQVRDENGNVVSGALSFFGYDTTLISVLSDGYVTPKREETSSEIGTWISASIAGQYVANTCVVRVLSKDYNFLYTEVKGENTVLYYPSTINGENISVYVTQYQMPVVIDYAYKNEETFMGLKPSGGCKQICEVDFGETEGQRVCGISGNPIRFGWNVLGNTWQNCFLVPFLSPRSPQWGVMFHELGHNFTLASNSFTQGLGIDVYTEGMATAIGVSTSMRILLDSAAYPIGVPARTSIKWVLDRDTTNFIKEVNSWVAAGAQFGSFNPDLADGIWLLFRRVRPSDFAMRFFLPLQPQYESHIEPFFSAINFAGDSGKHTFFAALVSASVGRDLSSEFATNYHFPLVQSLFNGCYSTLSGIIDSILSIQSIGPPVLATPSSDSTGVTTNPIFTWSTSAGATSYHLQVSTDSLFAVTAYDTTGIMQTAKSVSGLSYQTKYYWRVNATNGVRTSDWSKVWNFTTGTATSIEEVSSAVPKYILYQNYPDPLNPTTIINYQLSMISHVTLKVYDILGREVATLVDQRQSAGNYNVPFDASKLPSGTYFYRLVAGNYTSVKKMVVIK